jgi:hypothetical protein
MTSLKVSLRVLIAENGLKTVSDTLQEILKDDYAFLQAYFGKTVAPVVAVKNVMVPAAVPAPVAVPAAAPAPVVIAEANSGDLSTIIKTVKVSSKKGIVVEAPVEAQVEAPVPVVSEDTKTVQIEDKKYRDSKEIKKWQKEMEEKKRLELSAKGITADQVLTKENLKQWIEVEGQTFSWVAREKAGCSDIAVSEKAKGFGILSTFAKRRQLIRSQS